MADDPKLPEGEEELAELAVVLGSPEAIKQRFGPALEKLLEDVLEGTEPCPQCGKPNPAERMRAAQLVLKIMEQSRKGGLGETQGDKRTPGWKLRRKIRRATELYELKGRRMTTQELAQRTGLSLVMDEDEPTD